MCKNNILLSLTLHGLLLLSVLDFAYASRHPSDKKSKSHHLKLKSKYRKHLEGYATESSSTSTTLVSSLSTSEKLPLAGEDKSSDDENDNSSRDKADSMNEEEHLALDNEYLHNSDYDTNDKETSLEKKQSIMRSLKAGDIFTPYELLPVTARLLKKVDLPAGVGKGIVSAAKSSEDLADRIFASYFMTTDRIVTLKAEDIAGLDALQDLAVRDDPKEKAKYMVRTMSQAPKIVIRQPDKEFQSHLPPKRSRYKLLMKKETIFRRKAERLSEMKKRRNLVMQLQKKLGQKRHLVVNPKSGKRKEKRRMQSFRKALLEPGCTWHYECRDPHDLQSCNLKAKCNNETLSNGHMEGIITPSPTQDVSVSQNFRRAVGVAKIDEEVEKIIERHVLLIRPENLQEDLSMESLSQYFNKLVMAQNAGSTTPIYATDDPNPVPKEENDITTIANTSEDDDSESDIIKQKLSENDDNENQHNDTSFQGKNVNVEGENEKEDKKDEVKREVVLPFRRKRPNRRNPKRLKSKSKRRSRGKKPMKKSAHRIVKLKGKSAKST